MLIEHVVFRKSNPPQWFIRRPDTFEGAYHVYLPEWLPVDEWSWSADKWAYIWSCISVDTSETPQKNLFGMLDWGMQDQIWAFACLRSQRLTPLLRGLVGQFALWLDTPHTNRPSPWSPKQWHFVKQACTTPLPKVDWNDTPGIQDVTSFYL